MELSSTSSSVWPGYVAAVSSLVLSLLLLAGVLVVSISQATSWHHYAIVQDGLGGAILYIDGVQKLTRVNSDTTFISRTMSFGGAPSSELRGVNGSMRDIKVFDVNLNSTQVLNLSRGQAKHHDGQVHSPSQFVFATQAGQTDLQGLAAQFDTNQDGVFDAKDALFGQFAVWQDRNQNGATDTGEVRSLADWGIQSIALQSDGTVRSPATGVHEAGRSSTTNADGTKMLVADASFDFATLTGVAVSSAVHGQVDLASDASANVLRITLQDVLAQTAPNLFNASNTSTISGTGLNGTEGKHQLMVRGSANDFAQVSNLSTDWSPTNTVVACEGQSYSVYNAKTCDAQLLIDLRMVNASHVL